jgi:integrase
MALTFRTKSDILSLPAPTDRDSMEVWHESQPGFGVRIHRASARTGEIRRAYIARYSSLQVSKDEPKEVVKKDHKPVLGTLAEISFDDAADKARTLRMQAAHKRKTGEDPVPTLHQAYTRLMALKEQKLSEATREDYDKRMGYLKQHWHTNVLSLSKPALWEGIYLDISGASGRATAVGVIRLVKTVFRWLKDGGVVALDPTATLSNQGLIRNGPPRQRFIKRADFPKFWTFIHTKLHPSVRDYLLFILFTAVRSSVAGAMTWDKIHMAERLVLVPEELRGNKSRKEVWIPVSDYLFENVLQPRHETRGDSPHVFGSTRLLDGPLHDVRGTLKYLHQETGIRVSVHDIRRTAGTLANEATGDGVMVSRMLSHSVHSTDQSTKRVTAVYIVHEDFQYREAFNQLAEAILAYATAKVAPVETMRSLVKMKKGRLEADVPQEN